MTKKTDDTKVESAGEYLAGRNIGFCVTGGIAAIETPKIARMLRRYGANVRAYMTPAAQEFVGKAALEWGTENAVVDRLSGLAEHLCREDAVLVCPATLDTIDKVMAGIADNPVTTLVASALGMRKPIFLAPTMHDSLYENPILQKKLAEAVSYGVSIIEPRHSEGKRKIPHLETIVARVSHELSSDPIRGKKVLVTAGPTPVRIDAVRRITNVFKGTLGVEIAKEAYLRGADVTLLLGDTALPVPEYIRVRWHADYDSYVANVFDELSRGYDVGIFSAAVADYRPVNVVDGKIPSGGALQEIKLAPTAKVIKRVREEHPSLFMATFKLECNKTQEELIGIARDRVAQGYDLVVANRLSDMATGHTAFIVDDSGVIGEPLTKREIACGLVSVIGKRLS